MLNLTTNKNPNKNTIKANKKLEFSDIQNLYTGKQSNELLIGLEYERLSLDKNTLENAPYCKLEKIIELFSKQMNWELIFDDKTLIGAHSKTGTSISLEPGCQLEISLAPKKDITSIEIELSKIITLLDKIAEIYDVIFVGYGISPVSNVDKIELLQKNRYKIMNNYLPNCKYGELSQKMMRQTAGIQVNIDYFNKEDLYTKLKFFNCIMPFLTALCSNSPLQSNRLTNKKSLRAEVWRYTGSERCNFFYKNIFNEIFQKKNIINNYIDSIMNVPMIFIEREAKIIEINGKISFKEFYKNGFLNYSPELKDYILHQSLCFPDVRLKKYIEIRNHDSANPNTALALCALYKGLCKCDLNKITSKLNLKIELVEELNKKIIKQGLDFEFSKNKTGWDVVLELLNFSKEKLNFKERSYLDIIFKMIKSKKTNADLIIDYDIKNAKDLIEFLY